MDRIDEVGEQLSKRYQGKGLLAYTGFFLGIAAMIGWNMAEGENWGWGYWLTFTSLFHLWEFTFVAMFHPDTLGFDSFLLDHSPTFTLLLVVMNLEYWALGSFFPWQGSALHVLPGLLLVCGGQVVRTWAMYWAGYAFHHIVQDKKDPKHKLVSTGIYAFSRHPAYFGWFWWAIGLQVLLGNPLSLAASAYGAWHFFAERIPDEEEHLIGMFGDAYKAYRQKVPTRIPGIP